MGQANYIRGGKEIILIPLLRKTGLLTYATTIWGKWFVVGTEQLSDIIKVWMLNN